MTSRAGGNCICRCRRLCPCCARLLGGNHSVNARPGLRSLRLNGCPLPADAHAALPCRHATVAQVRRCKFGSHLHLGQVHLFYALHVRLVHAPLLLLSLPLRAKRDRLRSRGAPRCQRAVQRSQAMKLGGDVYLLALHQQTLLRAFRRLREHNVSPGLPAAQVAPPVKPARGLARLRCRGGHQAAPPVHCGLQRRPVVRVPVLGAPILHLLHWTNLAADFVAGRHRGRPRRIAAIVHARRAAA
mmetsp:Transcript_14320/g.37076  ORF Transcript_14320/g.37076 Transcript_14320/m.37076 type:complete len:243 (+) Transcript_14320:1860-2588(+)